MGEQLTGFGFSKGQSAKRVASAVPIESKKVKPTPAEPVPLPAGRRQPWVNVTSDYQATAGDVNVLVSPPPKGDVTITLPVAAVFGQEIFVKRNAAVATGKIKVQGAGPSTIEGGTVVLADPKDGFLARYDGGSTWWIVSKMSKKGLVEDKDKEGPLFA